MHFIPLKCTVLIIFYFNIDSSQPPFFSYFSATVDRGLRPHPLVARARSHFARCFSRILLRYKIERLCANSHFYDGCGAWQASIPPPWIHPLINSVQKVTQYSSLTCLAVFSFKPIRALARVCIFSSYCTGSSILARQGGTWIHCQIQTKHNAQRSRKGLFVIIEKE